MTKYDGFVRSGEYFGKQIHSKDTSKYKYVTKGQFAYATIHLDEGSIDYLKDYEDGVISPMYTVFDVDEEIIDRYFLLAWFKKTTETRFWNTIGQGSINRRKSISFKSLGDVSIQLPPLPEQKKIASILGSVDDAIAKTETVIDQTRRVQQGLLQELLTRGIGHKKFKQTELGEIPEAWTIRTAQEICKTISVGIVVKPAQYYMETGVRAFRSANVREGFVNDQDWVYLSEEGHRVNKKSILKTGDVLVVRTGYPGTSCVVTEDFDGCNCIDIIFARPITETLNSYYMSLFINSPLGRNQVLRAEGGLAQKHFNVGELKKMILPVPPIKEQYEIQKRVSQYQNILDKNQQGLHHLLSLKKGLMSDLLTGRVRVNAVTPMEKAA